MLEPGTCNIMINTLRLPNLAMDRQLIVELGQMIFLSVAVAHTCNVHFKFLQ